MSRLTLLTGSRADMGHVENIEARLHDAQQRHYSERTMQEQEMVERDQAEREAREGEAIAEMVRDIMRDPDDEAMSWIADCYSHRYQTLCEMICRAAMSGSAESCRAKLLAAASIVEAQLSVYVAKKHFGGVRT